MLAARLGLGHTPQPYIGTSSPTYLAETNALVARITTPPTMARKNAINAVFSSLKNGAVSGSNILAKLDVLQIYAAADEQAALLNWLSTSFNASKVATVGFVADQGYTPNGVDSYINMGFTPSTAPSPKFTQNTASFGLWSLTSATDANPAGGWFDTAVATGGVTLNPRNASDQSSWRMNQNTADVSSTAVTDGKGWYCATRQGVANTTNYRNGVLIGSGTQTSIAVKTQPMTIGHHAGSGWGTRPVAAALIGQTLSANENVDVYNALRAYMTAVGIP